MIRLLKKALKKLLADDDIFYLNKKIRILNTFQELKKLYSWNEDPEMNHDFIFDFEHEEDVNERRIRDAEVQGTILINTKPSIVLEIGTSYGKGTAHLADNAKKAEIYTVNIPPEELMDGSGGIHITHSLSKDEIGHYYIERGYKNINQIYENTKDWDPDIGHIDVAFIDGCHDREFVVNDTKKIIKNMSSGSFIMWHDFNPDLYNSHNWIKQVMLGIEDLYKEGVLKNRIYHVKDSWIGIYKV